VHIGQHGWHGAVAALRDAMQTIKRRTDLHVVLSHSFVRFQLLAWDDSLVRDSDWMDVAKARFAQIHGVASDAWSLQLDDPHAGLPRLAGATDASLMAALRGLNDQGHVRLRSVMPLLARVTSVHRRRIPATGWLVIAEGGATTVVRIEQGVIARLRQRPHSPAVDLGSLLAQECLLAGVDSEPEATGLYRVPPAHISSAGVRVIDLAPVVPLPPWEARETVPVLVEVDEALAA
jgi:hypothetical protein